MDVVTARSKVGDALKTKKVEDPSVYQALAVVSGDVANQVQNYGAISKSDWSSDVCSSDLTTARRAWA